VPLIETSDGRALAYEQFGDPAGTPVFVLHGTPGCRLSDRHPDRSREHDAGLRLIGYDRPGYGRSTRKRGRRVVDCVHDVAAIGDALGIERFAVAGRSGGGPHALAVGARLPDRVTRVGCDVSGAPFDADDLDWFAGMDPINVEEFGWALEGEATLTRELRREADDILARLEADPLALFADIELSESDRAVLDDRAATELRRKSLRESLAQGVCGWVDDDLAFLAPWGFDLADVRVPVEIRYGASDVLVPAAHGAWLAEHVPHAIVTVDHESGHLSTPDQHLERLRALAAEV
jgi:pimeloyl-ACP methyl ester carboxylesterase